MTFDLVLNEMYCLISPKIFNFNWRCFSVLRRCAEWCSAWASFPRREVAVLIALLRIVCDKSPRDPQMRVTPCCKSCPMMSGSAKSLLIWQQMPPPRQIFLRPLQNQRNNESRGSLLWDDQMCAEHELAEILVVKETKTENFKSSLSFYNEITSGGLCSIVGDCVASRRPHENSFKWSTELFTGTINSVDTVGPNYSR